MVDHPVLGKPGDAKTKAEENNGKRKRTPDQTKNELFLDEQSVARIISRNGAPYLKRTISAVTTTAAIAVAAVIIRSRGRGIVTLLGLLGVPGARLRAGLVGHDAAPGRLRCNMRRLRPGWTALVRGIAGILRRCHS